MVSNLSFLLQEPKLNIYVGNLPKTTTEDKVRDLFKEYGEILDVKLIKDQYSHELRGFGFVEMPSKPDAEKAIQELNGSEFEGNVLTVNEARPRNDRSGGGNRGRRGGSSGGGFRGNSGGGYGGGSGGSRNRSW